MLTLHLRYKEIENRHTIGSLDYNICILHQQPYHRRHNDWRLLFKNRENKDWVLHRSIPPERFFKGMKD